MRYRATDGDGRREKLSKEKATVQSGDRKQEQQLCSRAQGGLPPGGVDSHNTPEARQEARAREGQRRELGCVHRAHRRHYRSGTLTGPGSGLTGLDLCHP